MKKIIMTVVTAILTVSMLGACSSGEKNQSTEPEVALNITVAPTTEEEYAQASTDGIDDPVIDDFSTVKVELQMNNMVPGTERTVKMTALKTIMTEKGVGMHCYGEGSSENEAEEDFSVFTSENIIYRKDITDEELKNMFEGYNAEVTYVDANGTTVEETLPFVDAVEFK